MERIELIIAVVTILGSGAAFKFYENLIKAKKAEARELRQERREENPETMFREDLLKRVEEMSAALESANAKILGLTQKVAELETENKYLQREIDILKRK
jgi:predicted nuclease with TOPRIM domain